jgi:hypothetical protein
MVGSDDDRPGFLDREKKSFSELDRMRRDKSSGPERTPRSAAGRARAEAAAKQYLKEIDGLFSKGKGGAETERLERAMRDARGTPGLAAACRAWLDAVGPPEATSVVSLFLDSGDRELVLEGLAALLRARDAGRLDATPGLRSQLRMLAEDRDDEVAGAAEELLEGI